MRISEIYTSTQGEGPRVGVPTIFLRFAGCNLKCPGWPCDTQHAIDPKLYRQEWKEFGVEQIFDQIAAEAWGRGARNICFTGGEPFLQSHDMLRQLATRLHGAGHTMEVFTNGTIEWPDWAIYTFRFVMDWKLEGSGEKIEPLDILMKNASRLTIKDAIKFTVASKDDLAEAYSVWRDLFSSTRRDLPEFFCGPVWDTLHPAEVVEWILQHKLPWRLNVQLHKFIWDPEARKT